MQFSVLCHFLLTHCLISRFLAQVNNISYTVHDTQRLYKKLFKDYYPNFAPLSNETIILDISVSVTGIKLNNVDGIFSVNLWLNQRWNDMRLRWDPDEYNGIEYMNIRPENLWLPDLTVYNAADMSFSTTDGNGIEYLTW